MNPLTVQILQLFIGSGILLLMMRITFQVGRYSNRLETLERSFTKYVDKLDQVDRNVTILLATTQPARILDGVKKDL